MVAFNFLFLPPVHTLSLANDSDWAALAVYLVVAIVASELATRARRRAVEAEQREREAELLADAAAALLEGRALDESLARSDAVLSVGDPIARRRFDAALRLSSVSPRSVSGSTRCGSPTRSRRPCCKRVSHDFRTPLATIAAAVDGLQSADLALTDNDRAALLETMTLEVARLIRLVGEPARPVAPAGGSGGAAPGALAGRGADPSCGLGSARRRACADVAPGRLPPARVDDVQIQRVLVNLIDNALKFSRDTVEVVARAEGDTLVVDVHDRGGAGAPGAGLGLSIARGFAEVNGGSVEPAAAGRRRHYGAARPARRAPARRGLSR